MNDNRQNIEQPKSSFKTNLISFLEQLSENKVKPDFNLLIDYDDKNNYYDDKKRAIFENFNDLLENDINILEHIKKQISFVDINKLAPFVCKIINVSMINQDEQSKINTLKSIIFPLTPLGDTLNQNSYKQASINFKNLEQTSYDEEILSFYIEKMANEQSDTIDNQSKHLALKLFCEERQKKQKEIDFMAFYNIATYNIKTIENIFQSIVKQLENNPTDFDFDASLLMTYSEVVASIFSQNKNIISNIAKIKSLLSNALVDSDKKQKISLPLNHILTAKEMMDCNQFMIDAFLKQNNDILSASVNAFRVKKNKAFVELDNRTNKSKWLCIVLCVLALMSPILCMSQIISSHTAIASLIVLGIIAAVATIIPMATTFTFDNQAVKKFNSLFGITIMSIIIVALNIFLFNVSTPLTYGLFGFTAVINAMVIQYCNYKLCANHINQAKKNNDACQVRNLISNHQLGSFFKVTNDDELIMINPLPKK